jgi:CspA family cold shock protein
MGFLSILSFIYGRKVKRNFRGETGTIKWFDPSKGYGFLIRDKGGDLFVHLRAVQSSDRRKLRENTRVRFSVENSEKGPQAENIKII